MSNEGLNSVNNILTDVVKDQVKESAQAGNHHHMISDEVKGTSQDPSPNLVRPISIAALIFGAIVAILLAMQPQIDPYTQTVLSLTGDAANGRSIFVMNCADCHGQWAGGKVGPSLHSVSGRLSRVEMIHQVVSGETPPMPMFQPKPQEMADLLKYLEKL